MRSLLSRLALFGSLVFAACTPVAPPASPAVPTEPQRADVQSIQIAIGAIPPNLTPQAGFRDLYVWTTMYDTVTEIGRNFEVMPSLAEKWEVSSDGTVWTFTLRPGGTFSNGDPVTAEDVAFSFNEPIAKAWPIRTFFATVTAARAIDARTVAVTTRSPDMSLPAGAQYVLVIPKAYYESVGGFDGFRDKPMGSGPYIMAEYVAESRVIFKRRPEPHAFRTPIADELVVREIPDHGQKINGMRTGLVDVISPSALSTDQIQQAETAGMKYQVIRNAFIFLSVAQGTAELKKSPLTDRRVRVALNYAIDKAAISQTLFRGFAQPLGQLALPGSQSWDPAVQPAYDVARARQLLTEAGYPNGFRLSVDLSVSQNLDDLAILVQSMLKEVNIALDINVVDAGLYSDKVYGRNNQQKGDLVMSGNGDTTGFFTSLRALYGCGRPFGSPATALFYCNPAWDRALDQGLAERDDAKRTQLYLEANRIFREDGAMTPLFAPASFMVYTPKIAGIDVTDRTQFNLDSIYKLK
ncbi:MAG: ABC transporter substrate-binding protein [Dehalococcoidia bacterium]